MIYDIIEERKEETREVNIESAKKGEEAADEPIVGKIHDAPEFLRDNEYIHNGYRINFNSYWNIFKSLFVLHNEFVNVWSHILGAIFVILLIFYTSLYIQSHKTQIIEAFDTRWEQFNEDWKQHSTYFQNFTGELKSTLEGGTVYFNEYAGKIKNRTIDYFNSLDDKLNQWEEYIKDKVNCIECIRSFLKKFSEMKEKFQENYREMKDKFNNIYEDNFKLNKTRFDFNLTKYFDEMNEKFHNFKEELMEKLDSKDMEWIDIYTAQEKHENMENVKLRKWPLFVFLISAIMCLSFSAIFHLFFVHSKQTSALLGRLDYAGISTLIAGSCYPPYYYLFYCSPSNLNKNLYSLFIITLIRTFLFLHLQLLS